MARPKTIFNPLNKTNSDIRNKQIEKVDQALAKEVESEESSVSTYFSSDLAQSVLAVHSDIDISDDLKSEPTKSIAELLDNTNIVTESEKSSTKSLMKSSKKSPKNKTKTTENSYEVSDEEKIQDESEEQDNQETSDN